MDRPALPTLRQLAYLVELSERLNFRVAAEAQFVERDTRRQTCRRVLTLAPSTGDFTPTVVQQVVLSAGGFGSLLAGSDFRGRAPSPGFRLVRRGEGRCCAAPLEI